MLGFFNYIKHTGRNQALVMKRCINIVSDTMTFDI